MRKEILVVIRAVQVIARMNIVMSALNFSTAIFGIGAVKANEPPQAIKSFIEANCSDCHGAATQEGGLDLTSLGFDLSSSDSRLRWISVFDRVVNLEMPPDSAAISIEDRKYLAESLGPLLSEADHADVVLHGRGPMRRVNRDEYEQNLRDILGLPHLDIRDLLPEDREAHHFNKCADALDMSRVQLTAYLDAAEVALRLAMAFSEEPPPVERYRAVGTRLFSERTTFGEREAMFFAKDDIAVDDKQLDAASDDPKLELALFRSAHWPYYGYPQGFVAKKPGEYHVRFSARSVLQEAGYKLKAGTHPVPMTFRARKPSGPDVSGDVRATGGVIDVLPEVAVFETVIRLREGETFEYSLLGLPVPLARNVDGGPPTYRYPPFPIGGQPGIAFQWLEVEGPLAPKSWPPESHRVLFDDIPAPVVPAHPRDDARRLLSRFVALASPVTVDLNPNHEAMLNRFEKLILSRLDHGASFGEAVLAGYKAYLCSSHFLYLREPETEDDHDAIAARLSHFLCNSRADDKLMALARQKQLRDVSVLNVEAARLISSEGFDRFVQSFTNYWLNLRHIRRDEPDVRLYPEYRFDDYLVESMAQETRSFIKAIFRENLPVSNLIDADSVYINDRLAVHYGLPTQRGSAIRKVMLPEGSPYGGLLTQAAILKVTANGTSTSPVVRGAWIMDRLLGQPPPPPPASFPAVEPDIRGAKTIRELLALHAKSESCAGCHAKFDPVGLALESFDVFGGWRTQYRGIDTGTPVVGIDRAGHDFAYTTTSTIDASGVLWDGKRFQGIAELKSILVSNPRQLARNLLHQFTVYATGTPVRFSDRAEIEEILDRCSVNGYRSRDLLLTFIQSKIFVGQPGVR